MFSNAGTIRSRAACGLSPILRLRFDAGRALAFSLGTRNSFIVLPFALALPAGWEGTAVVIVRQYLVELFGLVLCLWLLPPTCSLSRPAAASDKRGG